MSGHENQAMGRNPEAWIAPLGEDAPRPQEALVVNIAGFEGPLDLLLVLARSQKVDLAKISVLALAEQYLAFISEAQKLKLEIAADYLVMAAWLAYLKSKLLLPKEKIAEEQVSGEEMAQRLAFRLMRLEAMRNAAAQLMTRKRLGHDVFARGMPEGVRTIHERQYTAEIYDLLKAYAIQRERTVVRRAHIIRRRTVWSIKDARLRLESLVGKSGGEWVQLERALAQFLLVPEVGKTAMASSFGATLEMAREGLIEIRQAGPFAPLFVRKRQGGAEWEKIG
jgi:segregation and condensation protein A